MSRVIKNTETLKKLSAYEVVSEENLPDISGYGIVLRHKKSIKILVIIDNFINLCYLKLRLSDTAYLLF